ncbi:MAG: methylation-associated defense system DNA methyltransferase MAD2, partial [bacterium]
MTTKDNEANRPPQEVVEDSGPDNFFIDILTGNKVGASQRKLLLQKVLRQLIESYGFDRADIEVDYKHRIK